MNKVEKLELQVALKEREIQLIERDTASTHFKIICNSLKIRNAEIS